MGFFERNRESLEARGYSVDRLPPGQYFTERYPVLHVGDVPTVDPSTWTLRLFGLVARRTHPDVGRPPRVARSGDRHRHPLRDEVVQVRHAVARRAGPRRPRPRRDRAVGHPRAAARGVRLHDQHADRRPLRRRRAARLGARRRAPRGRARRSGADGAAGSVLLEEREVAARGSSSSTTTSTASGSRTATTTTGIRGGSSGTGVIEPSSPTCLL